MQNASFYRGCGRWKGQGLHPSFGGLCLPVLRQRAESVKKEVRIFELGTKWQTFFSLGRTGNQPLEAARTGMVWARVQVTNWCNNEFVVIGETAQRLVAFVEASLAQNGAAKLYESIKGEFPELIEVRKGELWFRGRGRSYGFQLGDDPMVCSALIKSDQQGKLDIRIEFPAAETLDFARLGQGTFLPGTTKVWQVSSDGKATFASRDRMELSDDLPARKEPFEFDAMQRKIHGDNWKEKLEQAERFRKAEAKFLRTERSYSKERSRVLRRSH